MKRKIFGLCFSFILIMFCWVFASCASDICLNYQEVSLHINDTIKLMLTQGDKEISGQIEWSDLDSSVATVDANGNVCAVGIGETNIMGKYNKKDYVCKVKVFEVLPNNLSYMYKYDKISIGETTKLSVSVKPTNADNKVCTFFSTNSAVASVNENGEIVGLSAGETDIIISTCNNITKTFHLQVVDKVEYEVLQLYNSKLTLNNHSTYKLDFYSYPKNVVDTKITWSSSDSNIVEILSDGLILAKKAGKVEITAETSNHIVSKCEVTVPDVKVKGIELEKNAFIKDANIILKGEHSYQLQWKILPENYTTENVQVHFYTTQEIISAPSNLQTLYYEVSVNSNGLVTLTPTESTQLIITNTFTIGAYITDENGNKIGSEDTVTFTYYN